MAIYPINRFVNNIMLAQLDTGMSHVRHVVLKNLDLKKKMKGELFGKWVGTKERRRGKKRLMGEQI
jgi:hypothetical protein